MVSRAHRAISLAALLLAVAMAASLVHAQSATVQLYSRCEKLGMTCGDGTQASNGECTCTAVSAPNPTTSGLCGAGTYLDNGACTVCPAGSFCTGAYADPLPCPGGSTSLTGSGDCIAGDDMFIAFLGYCMDTAVNGFDDMA
ncbi:hypothetical protein FOA52_008783 [Chlamydomonas sp. UWO 241]|nr:hypothetical protein FOA52_008783 [Chlamydomonas sp. UWO 241]